MSEPKRSEETLKIFRYEHGGSRIYFEDGDDRELVADTYQEKDREVIFEAIRATVAPAPAQSREDEALGDDDLPESAATWMRRARELQDENDELRARLASAQSSAQGEEARETWEQWYYELEEATRPIRYTDGGPSESRDEVLRRHAKERAALERKEGE